MNSNRSKDFNHGFSRVKHVIVLRPEFYSAGLAISTSDHDISKQDVSLSAEFVNRAMKY